MDAGNDGKHFFGTLGEGLARLDKLAASAAAYSMAQAAVGFGNMAQTAMKHSEATAGAAPVQSSLAAAFGHSMVHAAEASSKAAAHVTGMVDKWTEKTGAAQGKTETRSAAEADEAGAHPS